MQIRLERFQQSFGKAGGIEDRAQKKETSAGIFLTGCFQENFTDFGIAGESLGSLKQPYIQLAFDVRASSWDIWGGDQLQVDLIDPVTNQSILVTPVQWTNVQLATGGWVPLRLKALLA